MSRLRGQVVATTRTGDPADPLVVALRREGARVLVWPTLAFEASGEPEALHAAAERLGDYDWVVFTSARAVPPVAGLAPHPPPRTRVAAVGAATAEALRAHGWRPAAVGTAGAAALVEALAETHDLAGRRFLFPAGSRARPTLGDALRAHGADVERVEAYRTLETPPDGSSVRADLAAGVDAVTFTSPSAVRSLARALEEDWPGALVDVPAVTIGPTTSREARRQGLRDVRTADETDLDAIVEALIQLAGQKRPPCKT